MIFPLKNIEVCNERRHLCWKINSTCFNQPVFYVFLSIRRNPKGARDGGVCSFSFSLKESSGCEGVYVLLPCLSEGILRIPVLEACVLLLFFFEGILRLYVLLLSLSEGIARVPGWGGMYVLRFCLSGEQRRQIELIWHSSS